MAWIAQKKKQFIRWYYGEFVYRPDAEIIQFGVVRPQSAQRLSRVLERLGLTKYLRP